MHSRPYRHLTGRQNPSFDISIHVRMVDTGAIDFLRATLGGWAWREKLRYKNRRELYCWQVTAREAERVLRIILPFLRVKRESAVNAIGLRALQATAKRHRTKVVGYRNFPNKYGTVRMIPNMAYSDEYIVACNAFHAKSRELNKVGVA